MRQESIYCESCKRNTLHGKEETSGCALAAMILIGILLCLFGGTMGFVFGGGLIVVALIAAVIMSIQDAFTKWRCQFCGRMNVAKRMID